MAVFIPVDDASFEREVLQCSLPVLVEFGAEWCGPCKRLEPELEKLAAQWAGKVRLAQVNVDESAATAGRYQVMGVPTLILFVNGQPRQRLSGFQSRERILEKLAPELA